MIRRPSAGFSSRCWAIASASGALDLARDLGVAELGLGLALELRLGQLHADDRGQALADVVAGEVAVRLLEHARALRPVVERPGQRAAEARDVGAAVDGVDVVGEREHVLGVGVVVLERDLDRGGAVPALAVDRPAVERLLVPVQVPDERDEAALEVERALAVVALVAERDPDALGEVGGLAQALGDRVEGEVVVSNISASAWNVVRVPLRVPCGPMLLDLRDGLAALVLLRPDAAVAGGLDAQPGRERVHDGHADAVEAAGDLVAAAAELAAGVEDRVDDLERVLAGRVLADRARRGRRPRR